MKSDLLEAGIDTEPWFLLEKQPSSVACFDILVKFTLSGGHIKVLVFLRSYCEVLRVISAAKFQGFKLVIGVPKSLAIRILEDLFVVSTRFYNSYSG